LPDFTFEESDNYMYMKKIENFTEEELNEEYQYLRKLERNGGHREYALELQFGILADFASNKGYKLKEAYSDDEMKQVPHPDVEIHYTPESSSVEWFAYDFILDVLYIKHNKRDIIYEYRTSYTTFDTMMDIKLHKGSIGTYVAKKFQQKNKR
jgi:hypothetical protein